LCYLNGDGVTKSTRWAKYFFEKAKVLGHKEAENKLKELL